jgi:hypothetical protein
MGTGIGVLVEGLLCRHTGSCVNPAVITFSKRMQNCKHLLHAGNKGIISHQFILKNPKSNQKSYKHQVTHQNMRDTHGIHCRYENHCASC